MSAASPLTHVLQHHAPDDGAGAEDEGERADEDDDDVEEQPEGVVTSRRHRDVKERPQQRSQPARPGICPQMPPPSPPTQLLPRPKTLWSLHSLMSARLSRRIFTRPLCALLSNVIWEKGVACETGGTTPSPAPALLTVCTHGDGEGVAVWDFVVDDGLDVDGFQLELDGDVDEPVGRGKMFIKSPPGASPECNTALHQPPKRSAESNSHSSGEMSALGLCTATGEGIGGPNRSPSINELGFGGSYAASLSSSSTAVPLSSTTINTWS